jgi:hypothetical protein
MTVQVSSPDPKLEGPLGSATTSRTGRYRIGIMPDPKIEGLKPGLNLSVSLFDQNGQQLYISKEEILFKPGEDFRYDIQVTRPGRITKAR